MSNRLASWGLLMVAWLVLAGCKSVSNVHHRNPDFLRSEGSMVFVRPDHFSILGSRSMRDRIEVIYENMTVDDLGRAHVTAGVRNMGGRHWYDTKAPTLCMGAAISFYKTADTRSAPIYQSNRRSYVVQRGETAHLSFDCPVPNAKSYQIVLSDY